MTEYEICVMGRSGGVARSIYVDCADDAAAIEETRQFIDGSDIELWQVDRMVARFDWQKLLNALVPPLRRAHPTAEGQAARDP
jgi:hypothetical protein